MIIGIDPGCTGAIAYIYNNGQYFASELWSEMDIHIKLSKDTLVFMEDVTLVSRSSKSMSGFYRNVGWWECFFALQGMKINYVNPRTWQMYFNLLEPPKTYSNNFTKTQRDKAKREAKEEHKRKLKDFAVKLFGCKFKRRKDWDKADALLIAEWGRRNFK